MEFNPNDITSEHVLKAIQKIEKESILLIPPTRWEVLVNGKKYPPKEIMRYAQQQMNGKEIWDYGGGEATNKYLKKMGFSVVDLQNDPVKEIIRKYKRYINEGGLKGEEYKWNLLAKFKGRPNPNVSNFYEEIKSINFANLIYPIGQAVIKHIAQDRTELYKDCFKVLFNENIDLIERVKHFNEETLKIYRQIVPEEKFSHHQDERTMATFLTYYNPDKYTLYKNSFYQKYCTLLGIKPQKKGLKYVHYLELLNDFIDDYVKDDQELINLVKSNLSLNAFEDNNHKMLAQDILYQSLDKQLGSRNYWRIGTSDGSNSFWNLMETENKICIGWNEIGDLNEVEIKSKNDIIQLMRNEGFYQDDNRTLSRKSGEIFNFSYDIKIGDVILAQDGANILGIGIVIDEYIYEAKDGFSHQRPVEWKVINPKLSNDIGLRTSVYKLIDLTLIQKIDNLLNNQKTELPSQINNSKMNIPLNQILYGPPGTGKTYNSIDRALEIINEEEEIQLNWENRNAVKNLFDKRVDEGRILFTTFHQSMSYEDFIEGIKPKIDEDTNENKQVIYDVENGIFKRLVEKAKKKRTASKEIIESYSFDDAWNDLVNEAEGNLEENNPLFLSIQTPNLGLKIIEISERGNLKLKPIYSIDAKEYTVSFLRTKKLQEAFPDLCVIKNIDKEFRAVIGGSNSTAYWSVLNYINHKITNNSKITKQENELPAVPYVLIIDEINRGNVSAIFGELITLIEEDKRLGKKEALEVTLPYSKDKFGVPANLYIIGTMNTADRSVEALDAALRRRFCFEEMPPRYDLEGLQNDIFRFKASEILEKINLRIEKLLDKDHKIGHSYLLNKNEDSIIDSFYKNIIPLLQEYFFGDYSKIGLVLGKGFVHLKELEVSNIFAEFYDVTDDFDNRNVYEIIDYRKDKLDRKINFGQAIQILMNK